MTVGIRMQDVIDVLETLRDCCHKNAVDHGFWGSHTSMVDDDKPWNFGEKIALIHSELSEMFEAWRKGVGDSPCDKDIKIIDPSSSDIDSNGIKTGVRNITNIEEEFADVLIRMLDLGGKLDIDVGRVVLAKMDYNKSRPMMHGGRKC